MRATRYVVILSCLACAVASTAPAQEMKPKQVDIQYVEPKNSALRPVYEQIRKARHWRKSRRCWLRSAMPRRLLIKTEGCDGVSNAWYEEDAVTICYEYLDDIWKNVPAASTAGSRRSTRCSAP